MKILNPYVIIFENKDIIAVNKMSGISTGGDRWDESKERLDKLIELEQNIPKIFTIHRIDKETSGLVIFAKNREAHRSLSIAFEQRKILKLYTVIIHGSPSWDETICDLPLIPNGNKRHMTIIDKYRGKESITHFKKIFSAGNYTVIEARPKTGRIHQIRVHSAALGHPVVCDTLYGKDSPVKLSSFKRRWKGDPLEEKPLLSRLGLHAQELILPCGLQLTAPLSKDMNALVNQIKKSLTGKAQSNVS